MMGHLAAFLPLPLEVLAWPSPSQGEHLGSEPMIGNEDCSKGMFLNVLEAYKQRHNRAFLFAL